jgi:hypothetical protein
MTLGNAARTRVEVQGLPQHPSRAQSGGMAERYGADTAVSEWRERLVCSKCGSREIDMVVTGTARREGGLGSGTSPMSATTSAAVGFPLGEAAQAWWQPCCKSHPLVTHRPLLKQGSRKRFNFGTMPAH